MATRLSRNAFPALVATALLSGSVTLGVPGEAQAQSAAQKAGRGFAAIATPFLEIPGNIIQTTERDGALAGWTRGLAQGLGMALVRPAVGVYELVTAPFAAPPGYAPILEPDYPWSYFLDDDGFGTDVADR